MRISLILKILGLAAVAVCTSLIASSLVRWGRAQEFVRTPIGRTTIGPSGKQIAGATTRTLEPTCSFNLGRARIVAKGGHVVVSAAVSIKETRPNFVNLWSVRVFDETGSTKLSEHPYLAQRFVTNAQQNTNPTLDDTLALAPGKYVVQVVLYTLPNDFDVSGLADEATERSFLSVAAFERVTITSD